jgi:AAA15 family ATPase/GTPase
MPAQSVQSLQRDAIKNYFFNKKDADIDISLHLDRIHFSTDSPFTEHINIKACFDDIEISSTDDKYPNLPQQEYLEYDIIEESKKTKTVFIPLKGLIWQATCTYWDDIALSDKEEAIISCLQLLDPLTTRFTFKGENMKDRVRYSVIKTGKFPNPVPLATMGEGIQRIFAIALAMTVAGDGYLLIDEIETGLHHSIQVEVWRTIFKLAREWNVQVFATTHSWDCIEAFQEAAAENENEEAMLIRLQKKRNSTAIVATTYDKASMDIVTRQGIEVR